MTARAAVIMAVRGQDRMQSSVKDASAPAGRVQLTFIDAGHARHTPLCSSLRIL